MILRDVAHPPALDEGFSGVLSFAERPHARGQFQARVTRLDPARRLVAIRLAWIDEPGRALIAAMQACRRPDAPDDTPVMRLARAHETVNWSRTGMLVGRYQGGLTTGAPFRGLIRLGTTEDPSPFEGSVTRADADRQTVAVRFHDLPPQTAALLEAAIKDSAAS